LRNVVKQIWGRGEDVESYNYPSPKNASHFSTLPQGEGGRLLSRLALHQSWELADVAAGVAHEEAAGGADLVDDAHAEIAQDA
jgi:hypothetical protein